MTAERKVVHGRFRLDACDSGLVMASMRTARLRTGKTRAEFAAEINRKSRSRPLELGAGSIESYETGFAVPVADVLLIALAIGGLDLWPLMQSFVYG